MKYYIKDDSEFSAIDYSVSDEGIFLKRDGKDYLVDVRKISPGRYTLLVNNQPIRVNAEIKRTLVDLVLNRKSYRLQVFNERQKIEDEIYGDEDHHGGKGNIVAPMPGMVLRVEVEVGQVVELGQPLLVLEAMKMENEIRSNIAGTIQEIAVAAQQAVEKDDLLIHIE